MARRLIELQHWLGCPLPAECQRKKKQVYRSQLTVNNLVHRQEQRNDQDSRAKRNARNSRYETPTSRAQFNVTQRRQDICQRARACCADQLEHCAQVACSEAYSHGGNHQCACEYEVATLVVRLFWEPVIVHDFSTDEAFERKCGEHIQPEAQTCNLDHEVALRREVVQDITSRQISESQKSRKCHEKTGYEGGERAVVRNSGEAVDGWCL